MGNNTTHCVYRIVCFPTSTIYVGRSFDPKYRKRKHFEELASGRHANSRLQNAYNKWGKHSFYFEILESEISSENINDREIYWIAHFDSYHNGFNATPGGDVTENSGKPCTWNGIHYASIADAARANGTYKERMWQRLHDGYTCDQDMPGRGHNKIKCSWDGVEYKSMHEAANAVGISFQMISYYIGRGCNSFTDITKMNETLKENGRPSRRKSVMWNGVMYASSHHASLATGIPRTTIRRYISKGFTCDDEINNR